MAKVLTLLIVIGLLLMLRPQGLFVLKVTKVNTCRLSHATILAWSRA